MVSCKDVSEKAHLLVDGELSFRERLAIRFHLFICKYCRRYVSQLKLTLSTLRETDVLETPEEPTEAEIDDIVEKLKKANL